jgi:hypothetical protein
LLKYKSASKLTVIEVALEAIMNSGNQPEIAAQKTKKCSKMIKLTNYNHRSYENWIVAMGFLDVTSLDAFGFHPLARPFDYHPWNLRWI